MPLSPLERWKLKKQGIDPDAPQTPDPNVKPEDRYRKPGEPCLHPPDMRAKEEGRTIGVVEICLACGKMLNDPDLKD